MSEKTSFTKDPSAKLPYYADWTDWLTDISDTIATSTWAVPTGITSLATSNNTMVATIKLGGGTNGSDYKVTNHIVTAAGLEDERTLLIRVRDR